MTTRLLSLALVVFMALPASAQVHSFSAPETALPGVSFEVRAIVYDSLWPGGFSVEVGGQEFPLSYDASEGDWVATVTAAEPGSVHLLRQGSPVASLPFRMIPGWLSILPPLIAIGVALVSKRVIPSLFAGVWVGAVFAASLSVGGVWQGLLDTVDTYVLEAMTDADRASIILFSLLIGGMVGIVSRNGGMQGIVNRIVGWASNPKRGQTATAGLGLAIFFDDYANTLVVGNTMRPVTDRLRISREKLAYIVDSTAAPVACLALVTTWIGYEVGLIGDVLARIPEIQESPYGMFLGSIPYSFYPLLAIFFVFVVARGGRDFGPMLKAETRARTTGQVLDPDAQIDSEAVEGKDVQPDPDKPTRMINAVLPVATLVFGVLIGLYVTGYEEGRSLREIIGESDSYISLLWASLLSVLVAGGLSIGQRILTLAQTVEAWYAGLKSMLFAMMILILAWALSEVTTDLHTAGYLVSVLGDSLAPQLVPLIVFVLAAATAFATGSSWGAMGILLPLVVPLAWAVMSINGMTDSSDYHILYSTVSCVLAGSVWGDHCSPISDTTILSSMASGCDHIDHVRTQLPYAGAVGAVAILLGTLPAGYGMPPWIGLVLGAGLLVALMRFVGKPVPEIPA
ncbi:MAG: Na+/H+ antiporter NhaC family protein [Rhodothermales bacterium]|nr:Na+/H+ antiporter NhaC family protein [Rhodothermales bacterium]MBO6780778.1 Na+/H+ antiporter NhaC family protein [Rhodothermales bacterium]